MSSRRHRRYASSYRPAVPRPPLIVIVDESEVRQRAGEYGITLAGDRIFTITGKTPDTFADEFGRTMATATAHAALSRTQISLIVSKIKEISQEYFTWERVKRIVTSVLGRQLVRLIASGEDLIQVRGYFAPSGAH